METKGTLEIHVQNTDATRIHLSVNGITRARTTQTKSYKIANDLYTFI